MTTRSWAEFDAFLMALAVEHPELGPLEHEYRFHPVRKFRADWALVGGKCLFEYEGLMRGDASHASIKGILRDIDKANLAQIRGYRLIRVTAKSIQDGSAFTLAEQALGLREEEIA